MESLKSSGERNMSKEEILSKILELKAVAVIRADDESKIVDVANALRAGCVNILEITMTVPNAISVIKNLTKLNLPEVIIGVGSVTNKTMAEEAIDAGAQFIVSPITKKEIIDFALSRDKVVMPGAFTPTEILNAYELGADIVKVFPADVLGMPFFKGIKAPMPYLKIMPTGGVTIDNACDWIKAGACAVGIGSALVDKKAIKENRFDVIEKNAKALSSNLKMIY